VTSAKKRILYISNNAVPLPSQITDGGQLRLYSLASAIAKEPNHFIVSATIRIRFVAMNFAMNLAMNFPLLRIMTMGLDVLLRRPDVVFLSYPNFPFFLRELGQRFGPFSRSFLFLLGICKRLQRIRMIVDADDLISAEITAYTRPIERRGSVSGKHIFAFERTLFSLADVIWVISANEAEWIRQTYRVYGKFLIVPNGNLRSDLLPEPLRKGKIRFVYAGALYRDRREIVHLLQIFNSLDASDIELYLMGPGGEWIPRDLLGPNVRYLGRLPHREAERYVKACDVGLMLYTSEERFLTITFPVKLALYITNELPVISLDSSAIAKFVHENRIGLTTTSELLPEKILQIAHNDTLRRSLKANCRKIGSEYYFDTIFNKAICTSLRKLFGDPTAASLLPTSKT
jgi:glycosyltransferase involved in cell wall biosynthesis